MPLSPLAPKALLEKNFYMATELSKETSSDILTLMFSPLKLRSLQKFAWFPGKFFPASRVPIVAGIFSHEWQTLKYSKEFRGKHTSGRFRDFRI
jgi:hypothetical protein